MTSSIWRLALVGLLPLIAGCEPRCENRVLREVASPDGARRAVVFSRECGATTAFSTQVSVLPSGRAPAGAGNVFVADGDHGQAPPGPGGGPTVRVRWLDAQTLEVRYDRRARVFKQEALHASTAVRFVPDTTA